MPRKASSTSTPARKTSGDDARRATTIRFTTTRFNSSAFCENANPDEDWTKIPDLAERRRIQNRIAQRNYRKKLKQRLEEGQHSDSDSGSKSPTPPFGSLSRRQSPSFREVPRSRPSMPVPCEARPIHQRAPSSTSSIFSEPESFFGAPLAYSPPALTPDEGDSPYGSYRPGSSSAASYGTPLSVDDLSFTHEPMQMQQPMFSNDFSDWNPFETNFSFDQDSSSWGMDFQQQQAFDSLSPFAFEQTPPLSPFMNSKAPLKTEADPTLCFSLEPQHMMGF